MINNWVKRAAGELDRIEARFSGAAFAPHRHDTYAIGITLSGVQAFDYRGTARHSLAGQVVIIHPDELHDGRAGTDADFHYRTLYLEPAMLQRALGGQCLPFIEGGVSTDRRLKQALAPLLRDYERPLEDWELEEGLITLALALNAVAGRRDCLSPHNYGAALLARAYLDDHVHHAVALPDLERVSAQDRWQLSRDFRAVFGTSPYRYLILRRLSKARAMLLAGHRIVDAAAACAFADQSHFTRHFKKTFGMTPRAWLRSMGLVSSVRTSIQ